MHLYHSHTAIAPPKEKKPTLTDDYFIKNNWVRLAQFLLKINSGYKVIYMLEMKNVYIKMVLLQQMALT